jgi:hypothetical protein
MQWLAEAVRYSQGSRDRPRSLHLNEKPRVDQMLRAQHWRQFIQLKRLIFGKLEGESVVGTGRRGPQLRQPQNLHQYPSR